jgi:hypothetical protein
VTPAGPIPKALRPIFRDRQDFDAGASLHEQTRVALDESAALVFPRLAPRGAQQLCERRGAAVQIAPPRPGRDPFGVEGNPDGLEKDCFPPALRPDSPVWKQKLARLYQ